MSWHKSLSQVEGSGYTMQEAQSKAHTCGLNNREVLDGREIESGVSQVVFFFMPVFVIVINLLSVDNI